MACIEARKTAGTAGTMITMNIAADATIYPGSLVANDQGKATPAVKAENLTVLGVAYRVGGGTVTIERGAHLWDNDTVNPVLATHIGTDCYIADDCTVTALAAGSSVAGRVLGFEDDQVVVETL